MANNDYWQVKRFVTNMKNIILEDLIQLKTNKLLLFEPVIMLMNWIWTDENHASTRRQVCNNNVGQQIKNSEKLCNSCEFPKFLPPLPPLKIEIKKKDEWFKWVQMHKKLIQEITKIHIYILHDATVIIYYDHDLHTTHNATSSYLIFHHNYNLMKHLSMTVCSINGINENKLTFWGKKALSTMW